MRFYGNISGQYLDETVTNVNWLAPGIGLVKWTESDGQTTDTGILSATSPSLADLSVFQLAAPVPLRLGKAFTYRIQVTNNGPDPATHVILADIDGDRRTTLADAIIALQCLTAGGGCFPIRQDYATSGTDINGDGRAGPQEAVYVLEALAGVRGKP